MKEKRLIEKMWKITDFILQLKWKNGRIKKLKTKNSDENTINSFLIQFVSIYNFSLWKPFRSFQKANKKKRNNKRLFRKKMNKNSSQNTVKSSKAPSSIWQKEASSANDRCMTKTNKFPSAMFKPKRFHLICVNVLLKFRSFPYLLYRNF